MAMIMMMIEVGVCEDGGYYCQGFRPTTMVLALESAKLPRQGDRANSQRKIHEIFARIDFLKGFDTCVIDLVNRPLINPLELWSSCQYQQGKLTPKFLVQMCSSHPWRPVL